jgi:Tol biopolymer transport system component
MLPRIAGVLIIGWIPVTGFAQQPVPPRLNGGIPTVSPDGGRIAFSSHRDGRPDLYVTSLEGTEVRRITDSPEAEGRAEWTADGNGLQYAVFARDTATLYRFGLEGGMARAIAKVPGRAPVLSRDGTRLLYTTGSFTENRLVLMNVADGGSRELTGGAEAIFNHVWSPDGRRIAYTRMDSSRVLQIWVMDADGGNARPVTRFTAEEGRPQVPAWSPDGGRLAFQANRRAPEGATAHVYVVELATGMATRLAPHDRPYVDETPGWFPDGTRLAFQSDRSGRMEVWVMNADGSEPRQVTR